MTNIGPVPWVASDASPHVALTRYQESLPVSLIATARAEFISCRPDEAVSDVIERHRANEYDFLPVLGLRAEDDSVVGLLELAHARDAAVPGVTVGQRMQPLGERHLIGADASILAFIRDADRQPFRFVVSGHHIGGLVTLSDLQLLPVRAALFAMVTHLEMSMADGIRTQCPHTDNWLSLLSEERAAKVKEKMKTAKTENTLVDPLLYTEFSDKVTIIKKAWSSFADESKERKKFVQHMKDIQKLRDNLAHANDYAATRDAARGVCQCVRQMDDWSRFLTRSRLRPDGVSPQSSREGG